MSRGRQPQRPEMGLEQLLIRQLQRWGTDGTRHHPHRIGEEILIVRGSGAAVAEHQRWLTATTRAAAALRIVGRGGRHIAHVDGVERGDVHAQLHGWRAIHQTQRRAPERVFPALPFPRIHLGGVLPGKQCLQEGSPFCGDQIGQIRVEATEVGVHRPAATAALASHHQQLGVAVLRFGLGIHKCPTQGRAVEPPALHHFAGLPAQAHLHLFHQAPSREHLQDVPHYLLVEVVFPLETSVEVFHRAPAFTRFQPTAEFPP